MGDRYPSGYGMAAWVAFPPRPTGSVLGRWCGWGKLPGWQQGGPAPDGVREWIEGTWKPSGVCRKGAYVAVKTIISGLAALAPGIRAIQAMIRESRGRKRELLRELSENINRIGVYLESGASPARLEQVVPGLESGVYRAASRSGFDFNTLKKGRLKAETVKDLPQFRGYVGLTTEDLFDKLYAWIHRLKIIVADYPDDPRFRKKARLLNIWKLMLVLVRHIKS